MIKNIVLVLTASFIAGCSGTGATQETQEEETAVISQDLKDICQEYKTGFTLDRNMSDADITEVDTGLRECIYVPIQQQVTGQDLLDYMKDMDGENYSEDRFVAFLKESNNMVFYRIHDNEQQPITVMPSNPKELLNHLEIPINCTQVKDYYDLNFNVDKFKCLVNNHN